MSKITFVVGGVDLSDYCDEECYTVTREPKYEDTQVVNVNGESIQKLLGFSVSITLQFTDMIDSVLSALDGATQNNNVAVTYSTPLIRSATFKAPSLSAVVSYKDGEDTYFNGTLTLVCELVRSGL